MRRLASKTELLVAGIGGLLLVAVGWGAWELRASRAAAQTAADNLEACRELAAKIEKLRQQPARAATEVQSSAELASRVEEAAQIAQLPSSAIVRIDPQPSRRVGNTSYKEQPTQIELDAVTVEQLVVFLHQLATGPANLQASSLRLSAPREVKPVAGAPETWSTELTLTYFIFAPKTPQEK